MQSGNRQKLLNVILWSIFFNGIIASLISIQAIVTTPLPDTLLTSVYLILQQLGHFQFSSFLVAIPLLLLTLILPANKLISFLSVLLFSVFILLVFVDYEVFKLYRFHLNGMVWNMLTGGAMEEIFVFDLSNIITFGIFISSIILLQIGILYFIRYRRRKPHRISGWPVFMLILLILLSGQTIYAWSDAWYKIDIITQTRFIPLPQGITIKRYLRKKGWAPDIPEQQKLTASSKGPFNYPLQKMSCVSPEKKPNILFIISDSLRFDMIQPSIMPVWSELASKSQVFDFHLSTGNATRFGVYGLFSGLFAHYWFDSLNNKTSPVLFDELKKQQYEFGFFANARLTSPEFDKAIFSAVQQHIPKKTAGKNVLEREYEITRLAKSFIQQNKDKPFFSFVFFDAPHAYVNPPEDEKFRPALKSLNYLKINNDSDPLPFLNRYKNAVHFTDRLTGELLETLEQQGIMDNTIIIMTGDHGQESNETKTNSWGHNSNFSKYQIQVPLVIYWPGKEPKVYSHLTSHVDVIPTLMQEIFSCSNPVQDYSNGQSLFDQSERSFVMVNNWNNQAIVNKDQVKIFPKIGSAEYRDYDSYKIQSANQFKNIPTAEVIESISRYYK
ncbi:MAG: DUF3413 domain-containing protein [Gammaproteobacteria bacterium]|jgi:hypothetical protein|nr:DUF3413 domain-containing protein [Gammaproteobacteria bacterium]MBT4451438.1 DUF3413 domain-containing protein [Gammaproteobacteria bacterium]MBT6454141.1 DUF3413 domain-containing protein [Gammaproteobacteria bacterium]